MPHQQTPLISRLRSLRRLWCLAMLALAFKLVTVTACMTDGLALADSAGGAVAVATTDAAHASGDACALGESGECHCACAHSVAFAAADAPGIAEPFLVPHKAPRNAAPLLPAPADSPLRPPIA